jgi:hypothetical protein
VAWLQIQNLEVVKNKIAHNLIVFPEEVISEDKVVSISLWRITLSVDSSQSRRRLLCGQQRERNQLLWQELSRYSPFQTDTRFRHTAATVNLL